MWLSRRRFVVSAAAAGVLAACGAHDRAVRIAIAHVGGRGSPGTIPGRPDLLVLIGDTVDPGAPRLELAADTPVVAAWTEHSPRGDTLEDRLRRSLRSQRPSHPAPPPRSAGSIEVFGVDTSDETAGYGIGDAQAAELLTALRTSKARLRLVCSSIPLTAMLAAWRPAAANRFEGQRAEIVRQVDRPLLWAGGDLDWCDHTGRNPIVAALNRSPGLRAGWNHIAVTADATLQFVDRAGRTLHTHPLQPW